MTAQNIKTITSSASNGPSRTDIAALIELICDPASPAPIRIKACEDLGHKTDERPELASFAAQQLFAKRDAGAFSEYIFDALIKVIRSDRSAPRLHGERRFPNDELRDAVDAVAKAGSNRRLEAENRIVVALKMRKLYATRVV